MTTWLSTYMVIAVPPLPQTENDQSDSHKCRQDERHPGERETCVDLGARALEGLLCDLCVRCGC